MKKIPVIHNANPLLLYFEFREGKNLSYLIDSGNAMIDRNGTIIAFSMLDNNNNFGNFVLCNNQMPLQEIVEIIHEFVGQFGLIISESTLVQEDVINYEKPQNVNLPSTVYAMDYGIRKPIISPLVENFKDITIQWKHNEVTYFDISTLHELPIKPLKVDLPPNVLNLFC